MNELILLVELEHVENTKMAEASAKKIKELIKEHPALDSEIGEILVVNCQRPTRLFEDLEKSHSMAKSLGVKLTRRSTSEKK